MKNIPTLLEMLQAGTHFGHKASRWHPKMKQYIFGERNDVHIINLEITAQKLKQALDFLFSVAASGGVVLFVGTKEQAKEIIKKHAEDCGMPFVVSRWLGGTFTNFKTIKSMIDKYKDLKSRQASGALAKYTKKEQLDFQKEIERLDELVGGIQNLNKLPEVIFVVDAKADRTAIEEAQKRKVPVAGICDTNINPDDFDYPIPANDDAVKSIELIVGLAAEAIKDGRAEFDAKRGVVSTAPVVPAVEKPDEAAAVPVIEEKI